MKQPTFEYHRRNEPENDSSHKWIVSTLAAVLALVIALTVLTWLFLATVLKPLNLAPG